MNKMTKNLNKYSKNFAADKLNSIAEDFCGMNSIHKNSYRTIKVENQTTQST